MRVLQINSVNFGSTGNIMLGIADIARSEGNEVMVACAAGRSNRQKIQSNQIFIGNRIFRNLHLKLANLTGYNGCFSYFSTRRFLKKVDSYNPDIVHLHNLHNSYINLSLLFKYIKKHHIPVVWTLHDCWAMTGQCPHFTKVKCGRWKTGCHDCPQYRQYPESYVDRTKTMWKLKKKWFTGVENLTIVTPSQWLADTVKQSFLKEYPVKVIHNGIDLSIFKPTPSNFREKHKIGKKKRILLGVAFGWGARKGLDVFIELSRRLDPEKYQIVLVGTDEQVDHQLPANIISIHRTQNQVELAQIYTAADVFVNPTREEVLGLVNIEANGCGTPVITFNTGGSPECIDEKSGVVVPYGDTDEMEKSIELVCNNRIFLTEDCIARAASFDQCQKYREYLDLYESVRNGVL